MQSPSANLNMKEPWTGNWKVEGTRGRGIWVIQQSGGTVKSTKDSIVQFKGKVTGNELEGRTIGGTILRFKLKISSDENSFERYLKRVHENHLLKGKRME